MITPYSPPCIGGSYFWNGTGMNAALLSGSGLYPPAPILQPRPLVREEESLTATYALAGGKLGAIILTGIALPALAVAKALANQKPHHHLTQQLNRSKYPVLFLAAVAAPVVGFIDGYLAGGLYGFLKAHSVAGGE